MSHPARSYRFYGNVGGRLQNFNFDESFQGNNEDFQRINEDDSKCARLLKKIFREDRSIELQIQRVQEFESYLEKSDNNKFVMKLAQPALNLFFQRFQERSNENLQTEIARCIGMIGHVMLSENDPRFADWILSWVDSLKKTDFQRQLLVNAFRQSIEHENETFTLATKIDKISEFLKKTLESVTHAPLMVALTDTILDLSIIYPNTFQPLFHDIVDILIGWYIEPLPTDRILDYTSQALHKFRPFWLDQFESTTLTLLDNFVEDADNYAQQFENDPEKNDSFVEKTAALYRAFGTVLRALSDDFSKTTNLVPIDYVDHWFEKIFHTTEILRQSSSFGLVAVGSNNAILILSEIRSKDEKVFQFIVSQTKLEKQIWPYESDGSLLRLIGKFVEIVPAELCVQLSSSIFERNSRLWSYRFLHSNSLIHEVLQLFQRLLTMKSIPIVEQVYQSILNDIAANFNVLFRVLQQKSIQLGNNPLSVSDLTEDDAEAALIFDCSALCQIGNVKGNLISMYALSPPLFELLAKNLQLTNGKLARRYPAVHFAFLKTLYSHCAANEHFIHSSDLFKQNSSITIMNLTSMNKDNFEDLLKLHHRLIVNSHQNCHDTKKLIFNWLAEIIDALPNEDNRILALPLLLKLSHAIIDIGYSDEEEICNLCCRLLNKIVKRQRDLDVSFLVRLFDLCRFWLQSNEASIHDSYYSILCCLPVNILTSKFPTHGSLLSSKNDYSGFASIVKRNHMNTPYLGTFTTHCFSLILGYILVNHQMPRMYATTWLERLFQSCQRKSKTDVDKDDHLADHRHHRLLSYEQLPNFGNDALIWFWAIWESAQFCVMNKLKTSLGKPQETFLALEETLRFFAWPIETTTRKNENSSEQSNSNIPTNSSSSSELLNSSEKGEWWSDLHRCGLLLQLIEALEKCMYNAYEGTSHSLPQLPKAVKYFFITNKSTCLEWLNRIRIPLILTAVRSGQYESAVRNCNQYLTHVCALGQAEASEFEFVVLSLVQSLIKLHNSMAIHGIYHWLKTNHQLDWPWIRASENEAAGNLEQAAYEYKLLLNKHFQSLSNPNGESANERISSTLVKFLTEKVYDCYLSLHQWPELLAWNEACVKMQTAFSQNNLEDLRKSMETSIDMNAIRAMSCFENRDSEGVKAAMRKMANGQSTGEELGRSISCGWDMEAFDMLATVETLKGVARRRSGFWSLNAVLQLTQDLTRIHNVDEHASWSEERAAISQVVSLYQSETRDVPLLVNVKFSPVQHTVRALNSVLLYSQPTFNNSNVSSSINSNWTALRMGAARLARQQNNFTLASKLLIQQFQSTYNWPSNSMNLNIENYSLLSLVSIIDRFQNSNLVTIDLESETGKLMFALSSNRTNNINVSLPIDFLSRSIVRHLISDNSFNAEKISRNLLHIAKWLRVPIDKILDPMANQFVSLGKLFQLRQQFLMNNGEIDFSREQFVRSNVPMNDLLIGEILDFSKLIYPNLAKTWFRFADWSYLWGRNLLARATPLTITELETQIRLILPTEISSNEFKEISRILQSIRILNDDDSELSAAELSSLHSYRSNLSRSSSYLNENPDLIDRLLALHPQYDRRRYFLLEQSCRSYLTYLKISNTPNNEKKSTQSDDASNVLVTLRLLRLLVRFPQQLRAIFENGLVHVPSVSWKRVTPQLFSRLNHPDSIVRENVTNLLIRLAKDFPQLILYSVIVSITDESKMRRFKSRDESVYRAKSLSIPTSDEEEFEDEDVEDDDGEIDDVDEDEPIEQQENLLSVQNSFRLLYNTLSETNAHVVGQVRFFVNELRRVTVLWDELWLGTMAQLQEEISRRVDTLKDEINRLEKLTHLSIEQKQIYVKEKQEILFKSFLTVLEAVRQITDSTAETPREQAFQKDYSKQIEAAIEQLKQPIELANPHNCWLQLRQLYSMLHRTGKRSGTVHAMSQISPKLSQIKQSVIPIPGDDGEFHTIHSVGQTVQVLPTKTRPKKLMFVGSNGCRYQYLLKGLEDLHLDERIMQLLSIINVMFSKINRNEPWPYEARNYTVIPLASRSGLIQWVEGATPLFTLYKRWQQRQATAQSWKAQTENQDVTMITVQKPNDVYYSKLNGILKEKGKATVEDRKDVPMAILRQCIEELIRETPEDLLARELWCNCPSVGLWYKNVQNYSRSLAVTSMIGYMIGLGDRHLDNVLVDLKTGQIIHIDYNICFEKGKKLRIPEKVPYRLTQNLRSALGVAGLDGVFLVSSENVLKILRSGKEILLNLLESFIYDPLIDWTGHDTGVLAAFYGGQNNFYNQLIKKKRQAEKEASIKMFHHRIVEIRPNWTILGESIKKIFNKLLPKIEEINDLTENLRQNEGKIQISENSIEFFQNVSPDELENFKKKRNFIEKNRNETKFLKKSIGKLEENLQNLLENGEKTFNEIRSIFFLEKIFDFVEKCSVELSASAVTFSSDFLQNAGKSSLVAESEKLDEKLRNDLKTFRSRRKPIVEEIQQTFNDFVPFLSSKIVQNSFAAKFHDLIRNFQQNFDISNSQNFLQQTGQIFFESRIQSANFCFTVENQIKQFQQVNENLTFSSVAASDHRTFQTTLENKLKNSDEVEISNYFHTLLLMIFDRWCHLRQTQENFRLLISQGASNETFFDELWVAFRNLKIFLDLIANDKKRFSIDSPPFDEIFTIFCRSENLVVSFKNSMNFVQTSIVPDLIRFSCAQNSSLTNISENLKKIFHGPSILNNETTIDERFAKIYDQFRCFLTKTSNEVFQVFSKLSNLFDEFDQKIEEIFNDFRALDIPQNWKNSKFLDLKFIEIDRETHRRVLREFFSKMKLNIFLQLCQLLDEHSIGFNEFRSRIVHDSEFISIIENYFQISICQNLIDLELSTVVFFIFSLIDPSNSTIENEIEFREFLESFCPIVPTNDLEQIQLLLVQINNAWRNSLNFEEIEKHSTTIEVRRKLYRNQLIAYQWKNFDILRTPEVMALRQNILQRLKNCENALKNEEKFDSSVLEKINALEQTVEQRLKWAAGANPSIQEILTKFENQQKQRNEQIENDEKFCSNLSKILESFIAFEEKEEEIKSESNFFIEIRILVEKTLNVFRSKIELESELSSAELTILENSRIENFNDLTLKNLPSMIEQIENDLTKQKRIRAKEEKEIEIRRDEMNVLIVELKECLSQHQTIFKDISSVIRNLMKVNANRSVQNYSNVHREFIELSHFVLKNSSAIEKSNVNKLENLLSKVKRLVEIKTNVFDELFDLDPSVDSEKKISSTTENKNDGEQENLDRTLKVIDEHNKYALEICKRIREKLNGADPDGSVQSSVSEQVRFTIREATDIENLATLYEGWTSWV